MNNNLKLGKYRHWKGGEVEVLYIATDSETLAPIVIYKALYECRTLGKESIWARPLSMFTEIIEVNGKSIPRFEYEVKVEER